MHPTGNLLENLTLDLIHKAFIKAKHNKDKNDPEIVKYAENEAKFNQEVFDLLTSDDPIRISYNHRKIKSFDKWRILSITSFFYRVVQHTLLLLMMPRYREILTEHAYNCIEDRGINSHVRRYSLNHRLKSAIYENKLTCYLQMDIRKCYQSTNGKVLRRVLYTVYGKYPITDKIFSSAICELGLPIGTPPSPIIHHLIMYEFDHYVKEELRCKFYFRYADDIIVLGDDIHQLHEWKHRMMNFLFYRLDYLVKGTVKIRPLSCNPDIGGYVYHKCQRNGNQHNKGFTHVRKSTKLRAKRKPNERTYFGIFKFADAINLSYCTMDFSDLVDKMRIRRRMDSPIEDIKNVEGKKLSILDYQIKDSDKKDRKNKKWIKMQVAYRENKGDKFRVVRVIKGNYEWLIEAFTKLDDWIMNQAIDGDCKVSEVRSKVLPIDGIYLEYSSGWVIRGTNQELNKIE